MIRGIHGLFYSSDPEATRAFFRDQVKLPGSDIGQGWWIFDLPEGDLGVHPVEDPNDVGGHDISFYCDDIEGTVRELRARGVEFTKPIEDHGYGLVTYFAAPGGITVQLYEPRYAKRTAGARPAKKAGANKRTASERTASKSTAKTRAAPKKAAAKKPAPPKKSNKRKAAKLRGLA